MMKRFMVGMAAFVLLPGAPALILSRNAAADGSGVPVAVSGVVKVARMTGRTRPGETLPNPNQTDARYAVWGTDLGIMWDAGDGQCLIAFGDTYGAGWGGNGGGPPHADWRSNVLAVSRDRRPQDGLAFATMQMDRPGHAREILASKKVSEDEDTVIPTAGLSVGRRQILHYMSINSWWPGRPWITNYAGLAYSDDVGRTWRKSGAIWPNDSHNRNPFQMAALVKDAGRVYLFGTPAGRQGAVYLARVPQSKVLDKAAYRYWTGAAFDTSLQAAAQPIVPGPVSELSVAYNRHFRRWLMVYLDPLRYAIVLRDAPALTGPWTGQKVLLRGRDYPQLYGGYIHPWFNERAEFYFTLSEWPLYNVAWMRAALSAAAPDEAGNLLSDPGFEDDTSEGIAAPWQLEGGVAGRDRGRGLAHSGQNNAFLRHNVSGWSSLSQTIAVLPGRSYRLTAWVRTSDNQRAGALGVRSREGAILQERRFERLGAYTRLALDFTSGRNTQVQIFAGMRVRHNQDTWIQIDDLSVLPR